MNELVDAESNAKRGPMARFRAVCAWTVVALLIACGVAVRLFPMTPLVRALLAGTLVFFIFTCLVFLLSAIGKRPGIAFPAVFFVALFVLWAVLGTKPPDTKALGEAYYKRLRAYVGTPFAAGGETDLGVDSSGLARAALWQAMVRQGIKEFNPRLLGARLWRFWWRDLSAADIAAGKYGYTNAIGRAAQLAGSDTADLETGDIAVSGDDHVMVYYGSGRWIEASREEGKVIVIKAPADSKRPELREPVTLVRWRILEPE